MALKSVRAITKRKALSLTRGWPWRVCELMREALGRTSGNVSDRCRTVKSVVEKFREKYGAGDVKKYYSKFHVAVRVELD
jgi:hypothetical protein